MIYIINQQFKSGSKKKNKYILIDLDNQLLSYFENDYLIDQYLVSLGKKIITHPLENFLF